MDDNVGLKTDALRRRTRHGRRIGCFSDGRDKTGNGLVTDLPDSRRVNGQRSWLFMKISSNVGSVNCDVLAKCPRGYCAIFGRIQAPRQGRKTSMQAALI